MFVGLSGDEADAIPQMQEYIERFGISWPNAYGAQPLAESLRIRGYPTLMVFGRDGRLLWSGHGHDQLTQIIDQALESS